MSTLRSLRRFPLPVQLLLVNQFGVNTGFYLLIPYLAVHLGADLGMSAAVIGVVLGMRTLSQQGLFLLGGTASDRLGPRRVIIAGCGLRAVGFGMFAAGESVTVLLAASVLSGLAGALFNPAVRAYVTVETAEDSRAEAFALFNVFGQAGALTGPVLGSALMLWDFRIAALAAAGIFAALTLAQAVVLPARPVPSHTGTVFADWRECLANRRFIAFTCALTGMFTLQNQLYLVLPLQAQRQTGSTGVAVIFLVSTVATLLLQVRITRALTARMWRGRAIALGLAVMGAGFLAPALATGIAPVLVAALLLAVGVMIAHPFIYELIPAFSREGLEGTYFGMFYLASGIVAAIGNAAIGWAIGVSGPLASLLCVAIGLVCAAGVAWLHHRGALTATRQETAR